MPPPVLAGIVADALSSALTLGAALTALTAGVGRYGAVLRLRSEELDTDEERRRVEQATARGFFIGAVLSLGLLVVDAVAP
jgi:hypothetical protein